MPLRPEDKPRTPGLVARAARFTAATARFVAAGAPVRSQQGRETALALCRECEHFQQGQCELCGCFVRLKIAYATEACPLGKWGPERKDGRGCGSCG